MDDSYSISNIPSKAVDAVAIDALHADKERLMKQVDGMCDDHVFSDEEEDEPIEESEYETESEGHSTSEIRETSMPHYSNYEHSEGPDQHTSYTELSVHSEASSSSQHSCCRSNSDHCQHSFQTQTQRPSEIPSEVGEIHRNGDHQINGHSSPFSEISRHRDMSDLDSNVQGRYAAVNGDLSPANDAELQEKCRTLQILYDSTVQELKMVKNSEQTCIKDAEQQKRIFDNHIELLTDEKDSLFTKLQASQILVSHYESEKKGLLDEVRSLEVQLADVLDARNEALTKLESSEITVLSLEKQLRELHRSENLSRVRDQHGRIEEELKMRHNKEVLKYKESIDGLQAQLSLKIQEAERLTDENSKLHEEFKKLKQEKIEECNNLYTQIEMAQEKHRQYLKNDTVEELNLLKLKVQRLQEENWSMSKINDALKGEIKSLKVELSTSDALQKMAFSSKSKTFQDSADGRQKGINLQSELENSLTNVRTLRLENTDLKKQLKDSENKQAQMVEKIQLNELKIAESEKSSKELEEKLKNLTSNESIPVTILKNQINSLEQELQLLKMDSHEMIKKLKEATSNEKFLLDNTEELQKRMREMIQKHSEEKLQAVEECRLKYLELHENVLSNEKEKLGIKAKNELDDASAMYENKISELQNEIKFRNLMDPGYTSSKKRSENENEMCAEYEKQLKQMKEEMKQKEENFEKCLKVAIERAQIDWTSKKMAEIKLFVDNTKQRLDEEFQNCLQKERNNMHQELKLEIEKLQEDYKQKFNDLKQQYDNEKYQQSTQLRQDFEIKWQKELAFVKEDHERETKCIKHELENKLFLTEMELKSIKQKLSLNSQAQEEVEKIKQEYFEKERLLNQEKAQLFSSDSALNENIKTLVDTEKRLRDKLKRYERHTIAIKKRHADDITNLQRQLSDVQMACEEKQNQLQSIRSRYEQQLMELGEKLCKQRNICRNSETQTEEDVTSKRIASVMEAKFFKCLQNISAEIRQHLIQCKNRNSEKQIAALQLYHQQICSKMFQELSNDIRSFQPSIIVPRAPTTSSNSKETFDTLTTARDFQNGQFQTSTPGIFGSVGARHARSEIAINKNHVPSNKRNSSPNLQTKPKVNACHNSGGFNDYFSSIFKNVTVDGMSTGDASKKVSQTNGQSGLLNGKDNDAVDRYGDISYDFIPVNLPADIYDSNKLPNGGLFGNGSIGMAENFRRDSLPVKQLPLNGNAVS